MKLLFLLFVIAAIAVAVYYFFSMVAGRGKKQKPKSIKRNAIAISAFVAVLLLIFVVYEMKKAETAPDMQCWTYHVTSSYPPTSLTTAMDYFLQGNYDYDTGNCVKAIADYSQSIKLNPDYPQTYNNRAYTFMRLRNYNAALPDLDRALALNPNYIQALMNRGDIHNYYYAINRVSAIADYEKVISLGGTNSTSVCGHLFLAQHNGWNLGAILDFPHLALSLCN